MDKILQSVNNSCMRSRHKAGMTWGRGLLTIAPNLCIFDGEQMCKNMIVSRSNMSTASISKDFSIRSQKVADSLLDALIRSGKKSKWVSWKSKNKTAEIKRINKLFAK